MPEEVIEDRRARRAERLDRHGKGASRAESSLNHYDRHVPIPGGLLAEAMSQSFDHDPGSGVPPIREAVSQFFEASALMDPLRLRLWDLEGLTITQLRLLMFVNESEGLSNAELAERLYVTRPSVSALLERLERGGFLRREISPHDRRGICIWLEDRGRNVCSSMQADVVDYVTGLMSLLSEDDLRELAGGLAKLVDAGRERRLREIGPEPGAVSSA